MDNTVSRILCDTVYTSDQPMGSEKNLKMTRLWSILAEQPGANESKEDREKRRWVDHPVDSCSCPNVKVKVKCILAVVFKVNAADQAVWLTGVTTSWDMFAPVHLFHHCVTTMIQLLNKRLHIFHNYAMEFHLHLSLCKLTHKITCCLATVISTRIWLACVC